ncbi:MAG: hypothetical protein IJE80_01740 [Peptococcaceae bacterium]|nr:hypothetical protein [Peptococcaceae bacterium]MBQ3508553.1 hypothetical protein [Peptococcaceae bacterium]
MNHMMITPVQLCEEDKMVFHNHLKVGMIMELERQQLLTPEQTRQILKKYE